MNILAFDPGKHNFAYALLSDGAVLETGYLDSFSDVTEGEIYNSITMFCDSVADLLDKFCLDPNKDWIVLERFMHRPGRGMGAVNELINLMIGMLMSIATRDYELECYLVTPAAWKNHMRRTYEMQKSSGMLGVLEKPEGLTVHEADAIGIACYHYELETSTQCTLSCWR